MSQSQINTNRPPLLSSVKLPCHLLSLWLGRTGVLAGYKRRIVITTRTCCSSLQNTDQTLSWAHSGRYFGNISFYLSFCRPKTKAKSSEQEIIRRCLSLILCQVVAGRQVSFCIYLRCFSRRAGGDIKIIPHILCSTYNFIASQPSQARQKIKL